MSVSAAYILLGSLTLTAAAAAEQPLRVGPGATYAAIGDALRAARPGDVISVAPGVYRETLQIAVAVRLVGEPGARVDGGGRGNVIRVVADDVEVRGLAVTGSGDDMMLNDAGIRVEGRRVRVVGNRLERNLFGIYLAGAEDAVLEDNVVLGRAELDVGSRGAGIHLFDSRRARVTRNRVHDVRDGIYFDHSDDNLVEENEFARLRYAIHYMFCADNRFFRNVMRDSAGGAAIMYTSRVVFSENRMFRNRDGFNAFGLLLKDCEDSVAERNAIVDNVTGIFLDGAHRNRIQDNLVAYNDVAVVLYASALQNAFGGNDFIGNRAVLHRVGRATADWAPNGRGNYYDDYRGFDLDGDGRGDVAHPLQDAFEYLEGNRPQLRLFLNSAAAEALALAELAFPVIPRSDQADPSPLMRPNGKVRLASASAIVAGGGAPALHPLAALVAALFAGGVGLLCWRLRR